MSLKRIQSTFQSYGSASAYHCTQPATPLLQITPGSLAEKCGLQEGDIITKIGEAPTEYMRHKEAQQKILMSGNSLELALER